MEYRLTLLGFNIAVRCTAAWEAFLFTPGARRHHPVVVRASLNEGKTVLLQRLKVLLAAINCKEKPRA